MKKYNHKIFLDNAWAAKFITPRIKKYWPEAQEMVSFKIEVLKIFLDYLRFTLRYRVFIKTKSGKILEKKIILKVERPKKFPWPPRIGRVERDFRATKFLIKNGLKDILPRPLEFYSPLRAYLYEEVGGEVLKNFIQNKNWRINAFFKSVPLAIRSLKKIHAIKRKPPYANGNHKKIIGDGIRDWHDIIAKYYPAGSARAEKIISSLEKIQKQHKDLFFNRKKYSVTHGDFQNDNIIIGEAGKIKFIDLSDSKFFNPLDDLASFLIQAEMHLKYVRSRQCEVLTKKLKTITYAAYFGKKIKNEDKLQIDFFAAKDILRIITFVSFTERAWQTVRDHSKMMDNLLAFAEEKIKKLETQYL
ncbi:MAG: phosphotransferase family protein [Patescibacteria group bacterium]